MNLLVENYILILILGSGVVKPPAESVANDIGKGSSTPPPTPKTANTNVPTTTKLPPVPPDPSTGKNKSATVTTKNGDNQTVVQVNVQQKSYKLNNITNPNATVGPAKK